MSDSLPDPKIRIVTGDRLTAAEVYGVWKIRDVVFSVEQNCREEDPDDLDLLATTTHVWVEDEHGPTSYLRVLDHEEMPRIGRVCTRKEHRGQGLSGALMESVLERFGDRETRLNAQAYLEGWYGRYGYVTDGPHFEEAGIDHVPMRRTASS